MAKTVKAGVIGCGHVSSQYFEGCRRFAILDIVACADLDLPRAREQAARYGIPRACDPEDILVDDDIELIVNLTPPDTHATVSLAAIAQGKHVYSEKPLAATIQAAQEIIEAATDAGVRVGCAPDTFLGGGLQTCRKLVDDGLIGDPIAAVGFFVGEHGYEHYHPSVDRFYAHGGGPMRDMGPYYVTALVSLLGPVARVTGAARASLAERTIGTGPRLGERIRVEAPTHVSGSMEFASGPIATIVTSWDVWSTTLPYLELYGSVGSLNMPNPDEFNGSPRLRLASKEELSVPAPPRFAVEWNSMPLTHDPEVRRGIGIADLAHGLRLGRPHRASCELAYHVLEVLSAFEVSSHEGRHIEIASRCSRPESLPVGLPEGQLD